MSERALWRWVFIVLLVGLNALVSTSCMNLLGGLGTIVPNSSGQLEQVKNLQETSDFYACFQLGGPPPIGGTTVIAVPKGVRPALAWGANCQPMAASVKAEP